MGGGFEKAYGGLIVFRNIMDFWCTRARRAAGGRAHKTYPRPRPCAPQQLKHNSVFKNAAARPALQV